MTTIWSRETKLCEVQLAQSKTCVHTAACKIQQRSVLLTCRTFTSKATCLLFNLVPKRGFLFNRSCLASWFSLIADQNLEKLESIFSSDSCEMGITEFGTHGVVPVGLILPVLENALRLVALSLRQAALLLDLQDKPLKVSLVVPFVNIIGTARIFSSREAREYVKVSSTKAERAMMAISSNLLISLVCVGKSYLARLAQDGLSAVAICSQKH